MYHIVSQEKPQTNALGQPMGMRPKRALFYDPQIGDHRIYRRLENSPGVGFIKFQYKERSEAESVAKDINEAYNDDFEVEQISEA